MALRNIFTHNVRCCIPVALERSAIALRMASSVSNDMVVPKQEVVRFIADCLGKAGSSQEDARTVAHHLMTADYRGHFSHGMNRLEMYVHEIEINITDVKAKPQIVNDFQVCSHINPLYKLGS